MNQLDHAAVWALIDRQRLDLADFLATVPEADWDRPSLCKHWQVRDVAAHLALAHTGALRATAELIRAGGSFERMIRDTAIRHAAEPPGVLIEQIRAMAGSRRLAPGITHLEPLLDVLVHGQDIAVPLGRPRRMPIDGAAAAATRVWTMRWPTSSTFGARRRLRGLRLVATDTDWSVGAGAIVEGPIQALLLLLAGRDCAARGQLSGPGAERLDVTTG